MLSFFWLYRQTQKQGFSEMKLVLKHAKALEVLSASAKPFGVDRVVRLPIPLLQRQLNSSYLVALGYLNELERRGAIVIVKDHRDGKSIEEARVLMDKLPLRVHEKGDAERVCAALRKYKTKSTTNGKYYIVPSGFFPQVHGNADVTQARLYYFLKIFEEKNWVEIVKDRFSTREKILFVILKELFPVA